MRITTYAAVLAILAAAACGGGGPTVPSGLCTGEAVVRVNGAVFTGRGSGSATAAEAGALVTTVARERAWRCDDVVITVTDGAAPRPRHDPWVDGDAMLLKAGTRLYERVGSEPGQELVAERAAGDWVRLVRQGVH